MNNIASTFGTVFASGIHQVGQDNIRLDTQIRKTSKRETEKEMERHNARMLVASPWMRAAQNRSAWREL